MERGKANEEMAFERVFEAALNFQAVMRAAANGYGRERALEVLAAGDRDAAGENENEEDWDDIFGDFLLSECDETMAKILSYLAGQGKREVAIYNDILEVIEEYQSDRLVAIFCETIPELDTVDLPGEFERLFPIMSGLVEGKSQFPVRPFWAAKLVYAVLQMSSNVSRKLIAKLQACIYRTVWPSDLFVALVLLRIERCFNEMLLEQRTFFADLVPITEGDLGDSIYIEQLLIRRDWPLHEMRFNLPYVVREHIGDLSAIEDELIDILSEQTEEEDGSGIIVLASPSTFSGENFITGGVGRT